MNPVSEIFMICHEPKHETTPFSSSNAAKHQNPWVYPNNISPNMWNEMKNFQQADRWHHEEKESTLILES